MEERKNFKKLTHSGKVSLVKPCTQLPSRSLLSTFGPIDCVHVIYGWSLGLVGLHGHGELGEPDLLPVAHAVRLQLFHPLVHGAGLVAGAAWGAIQKRVNK